MQQSITTIIQEEARIEKSWSTGNCAKHWNYITLINEIDKMLWDFKKQTDH